MTVNIQLATVTAAIAGLSVSGLTIYDVNEIPIHGPNSPSIIPIPDKFITNLAPQEMSFGASAALKDLNYTLNYRLLYAPVGSGDRTTIGGYAEMMALAVDFMEAVLSIATLAGCVDIQIEGVPFFGPVLDPAGNFYHGCDFALRVREFVQ